jgi:hypothetical protein
MSAITPFFHRQIGHLGKASPHGAVPVAWGGVNLTDLRMSRVAAPIEARHVATMRRADGSKRSDERGIECGQDQPLDKRS